MKSRRSALISVLGAALAFASIAPANAAIHAGLVAGQTHQGRLLQVGERLGFPPRDPPGTVRPKLTPDSLQADVDRQLKTRFESAAGSSKGLLTKVGATNAGWGFIADHFAEIDRDSDGYISFADVSRFMKPRSPLAKKTVKPDIQIVE